MSEENKTKIHDIFGLFEQASPEDQERFLAFAAGFFTALSLREKNNIPV